ncbi:MAG: hypothetical protein JWP94_2658 [Mucilaginibacter sp.]|nr:hypothetical protein [Mucilaginibacter sp.]
MRLAIINSSKKFTLVIFIFLIITISAHAQQDNYKRLTGRWRAHYSNGKFGDMQFLTDSTGALLFPNGLLIAYINIKYERSVKNGILRLKYTVDIHRKSHPNYVDAEIKFVNDSIFLYRVRGSIPDNADTTSKKIYVFKKIRLEQPEAQLRFPDYRDLIGDWTTYHKAKTTTRITFIDENRVRFILGDSIKELNYKIDFTKQPIPIDFYYEGHPKTLPAFLMFIDLFDGTEGLWIEMFTRNNRGDHLMKLGQNALFVRDLGKSVNK